MVLIILFFGYDGLKPVVTIFAEATPLAWFNLINRKCDNKFRSVAFIAVDTDASSMPLYHNAMPSSPLSVRTLWGRGQVEMLLFSSNLHNGSVIINSVNSPSLVFTSIFPPWPFTTMS